VPASGSRSMSSSRTRRALWPPSKWRGALPAISGRGSTWSPRKSCPWYSHLPGRQSLSDYTEQRLLDLAYRGAQGPLETSVQLYLCRDKRQALLRALKPKSLVVIGGKARWWPTKESKLAGVLRSIGHQVVVANSNDKACRGAERRGRAPRGYGRKEATAGNAQQGRKYWWTNTGI